MQFKKSLFPLLFLTLACSHSSKRKAQHEFVEKYKQATGLEKTESAKACEIYSGLSQRKDFSLAQISLIKAHTVCLDSSTLAKVDDNLLEKEPWLSSLILQQRIVEAQKANNKNVLAESYLKRAAFSDNLKDKVDLLLQAQKYASESTDANLKQTIQDKLWLVAPRFIAQPKPEQYYKVATDWILQRQFAKGRNYLKKISGEDLYSARKLYRNSFKIEQNKDRHAKECASFAKWVKAHGTAGQLHEAYVTWARAVWTLGKREQGSKILSELEKIKTYQGPLDEVEFIRARMFEESKDFDLALEHFNRAEKFVRNGSIYRDRIFFAKAWILRKQKKYTEAAASLQKLKDLTEDPTEKSKASFWLARSLNQAGQKEQATHELDQLKLEDALGYYGLLSYFELNQDLPALPQQDVELTKPKDISEQQHDLMYALADVGEGELLEKYLNQQLLSFKSDEDSLYFLKFYAKAGLYLPLFSQLTKLDKDSKKAILQKHPELIFPRRYVDLIKSYATKFDVPTSFILSIIRQESAFNPKARSPADALGLMQLLPEVARNQESKTGIKIAHFEDLYSPENNIPAGVSLLANLKARYNGQLILMAAAYNASDVAIDSWLKTRLQNDSLEFIEDIPYEETKTYIKTVLRNYIFYMRLENPEQALSFPRQSLLLDKIAQ